MRTESSIAVMVEANNVRNVPWNRAAANKTEGTVSLLKGCGIAMNTDIVTISESTARPTVTCKAAEDDRVDGADAVAKSSSTHISASH